MPSVDLLFHRLQSMRCQESAYTIPDYLDHEWQARLLEDFDASSEDDDAYDDDMIQANDTTQVTSFQGKINEVWREKICEWCYQLVDHFDINREVVNVAMNYLDRYLATCTVNRRMFQLAAMTALYLAMKLYEPDTLRLSELVKLGHGYFHADHIEAMEVAMLQALTWRVRPPTPYSFCRELMQLVSSDITPRACHEIGEMARFLTELSVCNYYFVTRKPSSIALASIINAFELLGPNRVDPRYKVDFLHDLKELYRIGGSAPDYDDDEIIECYELLRETYISGGYTITLVLDGR
ncbi:hypothetical protein ACHAWC_004965 [Mediolabrus comicus]